MQEERILSGNEAVARGAWEAGCRFGSGYPGTPSSEILPALAALGECYTEWSVNEKCALEAASGASLTGVRCLMTTKHVGLNVAADPLFTLAYTGVDGGLVIVSADDPHMHSSQNEQDNRQYARAAKLPMLEPANSQEALEFTRLAFELSEQFDTPVLLRVTTRICHSEGVVTVGRRLQTPPPHPPRHDAEKWVMIPAYARKRRAALTERLARLRDYSETTPLTRVEQGGTNVGFIAAGVAYQYAREALPEAAALKLAMTWPLPDKRLRGFAESVEKLYIIEELDPFLTEYVRALGIAVEPLPASLHGGELSVHRVRAALAGSDVPGSAPTDLPRRLPQLCAGCPHRGVFHVLRRLKLFVTGDIGCYTLGTLPPLAALDTCLCMGAGVGQNHGINQACGGKQRTVAVIGDSTFIHSGITNLVNIAYNNSPTTIIILDNRTTAMTGGQDHPGTGKTLSGLPGRELDLVALCKAVGIPHVEVVDPRDLAALQEAIQTAVDRDEPSVLIARQPCVLLTRERTQPSRVVEETCTRCGACLRLGCPAFLSRELEGEDGKILRQPVIDPALCNGCRLCIQVCPVESIVPAGEAA